MERVQELIESIERARDGGVGEAVTMRDCLVEVIKEMAGKIERLQLSLASVRQQQAVNRTAISSNIKEIKAHKLEYSKLKERVKEYIPRI